MRMAVGEENGEGEGEEEEGKEEEGREVKYYVVCSVAAGGGGGGGFKGGGVCRRSTGMIVDAGLSFQDWYDTILIIFFVVWCWFLTYPSSHPAIQPSIHPPFVGEEKRDTACISIPGGGASYWCEGS